MRTLQPDHIEAFLPLAAGECPVSRPFPTHTPDTATPRFLRHASRGPHAAAPDGHPAPGHSHDPSSRAPPRPSLPPARPCKAPSRPKAHRARCSGSRARAPRGPALGRSDAVGPPDAQLGRAAGGGGRGGHGTAVCPWAARAVSMAQRCAAPCPAPGLCRGLSPMTAPAVLRSMGSGPYGRAQWLFKWGAVPQQPPPPPQSRPPSQHRQRHVTHNTLAALHRAVLKNSNFFFVKDSPQGPPTANRQPPPTAAGRQPLFNTVSVLCLAHVQRASP